MNELEEAEIERQLLLRDSPVGTQPPRPEQRGIQAYLATERLKHHEKVASAPRGRIPVGLSAKQRMARKLRTKKGRELYAKRKGMIEPIFGQLKQVLGFRQFSLRGLASMRGEWRLMAGDGAQLAEAVAAGSGDGDGGVNTPALAREPAPSDRESAFPGVQVGPGRRTRSFAELQQRKRRRRPSKVNMQTNS